MPAHMRELEGKVAIVTGASRGIGAAIARRFAAEGAAVALVARTVDANSGSRYPGTLADTLRAIDAAGGRAIAIGADLSQPDSRAEIVSRVLAELGPIDILVNNAAASWAKPLWEFPTKQYRAMFEVHVHSSFELAQLVIPHMRERGEGWILNMTSGEARHPDGPPFVQEADRTGLTAYAMCKAALERFTTGLAAEAYEIGIAVNALGPSKSVLTYGMNHPPVPDDRPDLVEPIEDTVEAALALCSGRPGVLTGRIASTGPLLEELGRVVRGLDGQSMPPPPAPLR